jgi:hypothetical protein
VTQQQINTPARPEGTAGGGAMPTTGRWGWYRDHEGNEFRRVSKLVKKVETDTFNLDQWKKRQVGEGLAIRDDLVLAIKAMGRPGPGGWSREDKRKIDGIIKDAMEAAKQRDGARVGTAVHDLTERLDRGEPVASVAQGLPATPAQELRAYAYLVDQNGWRALEIERTVLCEFVDPETGAVDEIAGSLDRIYEIPGIAAMLGPGECQYGPECGHGGLAELPVIGDVKTEGDPTLNGLHIGPQLGIYSRARKMWRRLPGEHTVKIGDREVTVPNGEYVEAPCVRQDVAVVVHIRDGQVAPLFVNLTEGWEAAEAAYAQAKRETRAGRAMGAKGAWFAPMPGVKMPGPAEMLVQTAVAADYANPARPSATPPAGGEQVAVRDPATGLVSFQPATPENVARADAGVTKVVTEQAAARQFDEPDERRIQLIAAIWEASEMTRLAELFEMAKTAGVAWTGPVAMAGDARARIIQCPQRALHTPPASGLPTKCACGWTGDVRP